jgi:hypothetical protein
VFLFVAEEILDRIPDHARHRPSTHDDVEKISTDGFVDPREGGVVAAAPVEMGEVLDGPAPSSAST